MHGCMGACKKSMQEKHARKACMYECIHDIMHGMHACIHIHAHAHIHVYTCAYKHVGYPRCIADVSRCLASPRPHMKAHHAWIAIQWESVKCRSLAQASDSCLEWSFRASTFSFSFLAASQAGVQESQSQRSGLWA